MVTRRFKKVFSKQEQMRTFPIYDASIEVSWEFETFVCLKVREKSLLQFENQDLKRVYVSVLIILFDIGTGECVFV